jgi:hypothetical protein
VPCAISLSVPSSITNASESATERPTWIAWPLAVTVHPSCAGRRKVIDSSAVVYGVAGGSSVWIEHPNAMSATIASTPPPTTPAELRTHPVTGMAALAVPEPTSVIIAPVSRESGGAGAR